MNITSTGRQRQERSVERFQLLYCAIQEPCKETEEFETEEYDTKIKSTLDTTVYKATKNKQKEKDKNIHSTVANTGRMKEITDHGKNNHESQESVAYPRFAIEIVR